MMAPPSSSLASSSRTIASMPLESGTDALASRLASWLLSSTSSLEPSRLRFPVTVGSSVEGCAGSSGFTCSGFRGISTNFCSVAGLESLEDGSFLQANQSILPSVIEKDGAYLAMITNSRLTRVSSSFSSRIVMMLSFLMPRSDNLFTRLSVKSAS